MCAGCREPPALVACSPVAFRWRGRLVVGAIARRSGGGDGPSRNRGLRDEPPALACEDALDVDREELADGRRRPRGGTDGPDRPALRAPLRSHRKGGRCGSVHQGGCARP